MIIHITCPPGCGKTTLGKYISEKYPKVIVKDLDDLHEDFKRRIPGGKHKMYQKYVYKFIKDYSSQHIVFTGLNYYTWHPKEILDIKPNITFYMDIPDDEIIKRKIKRQLPKVFGSVLENKTIDEAYEEIIQDPNILIKWGEWIAVKLENLHPDKIRKNIAEYRKFYTKSGYIFIDYSTLIHTLEHILGNYSPDNGLYTPVSTKTH